MDYGHCTILLMLCWLRGQGVGLVKMLIQNIDQRFKAIITDA